MIWRRPGPTTVPEVHELLSRGKDTACPTVETLMAIMADRALVRRDESERSHTYLATQAEPVVQGSLLRDLMRRAFSGSAFELVQRALDDDTTAPILIAVSGLFLQQSAAMATPSL